MDVIAASPTPADRNIASPVMESHQKNAGRQCAHRGNHVPLFPLPRTAFDFVYLSQVQQGLAIKTAVTALAQR
jgi:beta-mannosidase